MKFLYLKNKRKSYTKIFFKICWQEHQGAGVDQSVDPESQNPSVGILSFWVGES